MGAVTRMCRPIDTRRNDDINRLFGLSENLFEFFRA
jgi:hypothetical protein